MRCRRFVPRRGGAVSGSAACRGAVAVAVCHGNLERVGTCSIECVLGLLRRTVFPIMERLMTFSYE